jgi:hypothetical protein
VPAAAAAAVAAALVTGLVVGRSTERDPRLERQYIAALRTLGGTSLRAARLHDLGGRDAGEVFVYRGHPSWVFLDVSDPSAPAGAYRLELQGRDGAAVAGDGFAMRNGSGYLGWPVRAEMDTVASVVVRDAQGVGRYNAQLPGLS